MNLTYARVSSDTLLTDQILEVYKAVHNAWESAVQAKGFYQENIFEGKRPDRLSTIKLVEGLKSTSNARRDIAKARGTIAGISLHDEQMAKLAEGLSTDLAAADQTLATFEGFLQFQMEGKFDSAAKLLLREDSKILLGELESTRMLTRVQSWIKHANQVMFASKIRVKDYAAQKRTIAIRSLLIIPCIVYIVVFIIFGVYAVGKDTKVSRNEGNHED